MRFNYHHSMCPVEQYVPLTQHAEKLGFSAISIPDSICYPKEGEDAYPYNADGSRDFLDGVPFIEPTILVAYLAAATSRIKFCTSVQKLAVHKPVMAAKEYASLGVITNNRFMAGVGISPWREDFDVTHTPWEKRGKRLDECIDIIRGLLSGDYFGYSGELFDIPPIKLCPVPSQPVPILIGGHSDAALKRAARVGDGWSCAGAPIDDIARMVARIHELRAELGRDHLPFEVHSNSDMAYSKEGIAALAAAGVTDVTVAFRNVYVSEPDTMTTEEKCAQLDWYASEVMSA